MTLLTPSSTAATPGGAVGNPATPVAEIAVARAEAARGPLRRLPVPERVHSCYSTRFVGAALERVRQWGFTDCFRLHHLDEPGQYTYWDYRARDPVTRGIGWRIDHIWATQSMASRCVGCWVDIGARRAERPSDHTFLVADFEVES